MDSMNAFDFYLAVNSPVPLLRENYASKRSRVQVADAPWCSIGEYKCAEFRFCNENCDKELIAYTSITENASVVLCRLR